MLDIKHKNACTVVVARGTFYDMHWALVQMALTLIAAPMLVASRRRTRKVCREVRHIKVPRVERKSRMEQIARHVYEDLHDPRSWRLDARRIAAYLRISLSSLAAVTGRSIAAIHKAPAADSLQQPLAPVAQTISLLSEILQSKEHVRTWLHSPHPDLGNQIPMRLILEGHAGAVADMLAAALAGQPA